ncbi:MAG: hypothetical protein LBE24_02300 [Methylobacillus sp.]|jgi:hypothetical protein|nr:hypothetical protein [Methylobacillus sp.]
MKQPLSLTLIACFLIIAGVFALGCEVLFWLISIKHGELMRLMLWEQTGPLWALPWGIFVFNTIATVVTIVAGVAMLVGQEWGRKAYVAATVPVFALSFSNVVGISSLLGLLPPVFDTFRILSLPVWQEWLVLFVPISVVLTVAAMIFCLFVYMLYQPAVTEYFGQSRAAGRPISLTIVAWFIIVQAVQGIIALLLVMLYMLSLRTAPGEYQFEWIVGIVIPVLARTAMVVIGVAILQGRKWSRPAWVAGSVLLFILQSITVTLFFTSGKMGSMDAERLLTILPRMVAPLFVDLLIFALFAWLLYRRSVADCFRR